MSYNSMPVHFEKKVQLFLSENIGRFPTTSSYSLGHCLFPKHLLVLWCFCKSPLFEEKDSKLTAKTAEGKLPSRSQVSQCCLSCSVSYLPCSTAAGHMFSIQLLLKQWGDCRFGFMVSRKRFSGRYFHGLVLQVLILGCIIVETVTRKWGRELSEDPCLSLANRLGVSMGSSVTSAAEQLWQQNPALWYLSSSAELHVLLVQQDAADGLGGMLLAVRVKGSSRWFLC